jgi:hypothetical protein
MFIEIKIHGQNADGTPKMRPFLISGEYHTYLEGKFATQ